MIIDAEEGYVLSNHHVIADADTVMVTLQDKRQFKAKVIGSDEGTEIALLKIEGEALKSIAIGDSNTLEVGDFVVAIGNPFGLGQTVTSGIVSALGRSGINMNGYKDFILTGDSINPGNSSGALVDGVLVAEVEQGSPAWRSGLRGGDVITAVNRHAVGSVDALSSVLERSKSAIAINIIRGKSQLYLVIQ